MSDTTTINQESQTLWEQKAAFWDEYVGEQGNQFHRVLVAPAARKLLDLQSGERVLDVACGNAQFSREMASLGAQVLATDFSQVFLERAQVRAAEVDREIAARISYQLVDATDEAQLRALGERGFDAAVCNMGLMDMPTIVPLFRALTKLLKPHGRFVFTISHPCFNQTDAVFMAEERDNDGALETVYSIKVSRYINAYRALGVGIVGEPNPHHYWHRSISEILNTAFAAGLVLDGLEEPCLPPDTESKSALGWTNFSEIPPTFVARLRLPNAA